MSSPSLGWERLNDVYYRNRELYQIPKDFTEAKHNLVISPFTKTIASYVNPEISIHSGDGNLINSINWNHHVNGKIIGLEWSIDEDLIIFIANGLFRVYFNFEGDFTEYSIGYEAALVGIRSFRVIDNLVFILLNNYKILYIDLKDEEVTSKLYRDLSKDFGEVFEFLDWDVLKISDHERFNIIISVNDSIYQVPKYGALIQKSSDGPFMNLTVSPNNQFILIHKESETKIFILTTNFKKILLEAEIPLKPQQISWCGSDAVVFNYQDSLRLVAPGGFIEFFSTNEILKLRTEVDGLTILTDSTLEFLNKIDGPTIECFKIGSTSNASILIDSIDKLNKHSPKANENLKIIGSLDNLSNAVKTCLNSSLEEFDSYWQKKLLKASSFGKSDVELKSRDSSLAKRFLEVCDILRILNNVRSNGIFLTFIEYDSLGIEKVIKLLIKRQKFQESFQIAQFLKLPIDLIFISWACCKIKLNPNVDDEELSQVIISKFQALKNNSYISFENIANVAFEEGRINLSKILINFESLFSKQIPILLRMEEHQLALTKAIESQDIDLILLTLLKLKQTLSLPVFFKILNNSKVASTQFEYFYKESKIIFDYYNQSDKLLDSSNLQIHQTFNSARNIIDINDITTQQSKTLKESINNYSLILKSSNELKQLEKQLRLVQYQDELTTEFNVDFTRLSIIETLEKLLLLNQQSRITKFSKDFKISEKKIQYTQLNHWISNSKYDELYEWINRKKPAIGYEPFIKKLIKVNQNRLALKILAKANLPYDINLKYLLKLKDWKNVIDQCVHKRDIETLKEIQPSITEPRWVEYVKENITKLENSQGSGLGVFVRL